MTTATPLKENSSHGKHDVCNVCIQLHSIATATEGGLTLSPARPLTVAPRPGEDDHDGHPLRSTPPRVPSDPALAHLPPRPVHLLYQRVQRRTTVDAASVAGVGLAGYSSGDSRRGATPVLDTTARPTHERIGSEPVFRVGASRYEEVT